MIESIAAISRWAQLVANLILFGSCIFLVMTSNQNSILKNPWIAKLEMLFPKLSLVVLIGLVGILATTTGQATGISSDAWQPAAWFEIVKETRMGHLWVVRVLTSIIMLLVFLYILRLERIKWHYVLGAIVSALPLIAGSLVSHSAAEEISFVSIFPYALHILLAGAWFGALPTFLLIVSTSRKNETNNSVFNRVSIDGLKQFSKTALLIMLAIVATGVIIANRMVEEDYHALVASSYGWVLNIKLALLAIILLIAYQARSKWLPLFTTVNNPEKTERGSQLLWKWVRVEFVLAIFLVLFATILANTIPAKHAIIDNWPYPFRLSVDATWDEANVQLLFWSGLTLFLIGLGVAWYAVSNRWEMKRRILIPMLLIVLSLAIALPPLAIDAYPETYRSTPVPFDVISISNGAALYAKNCVSCHGPQGKGNGILAKAFNPPPADLLTEPHTARHTAGDFFHWLTYGIKNRGMPGFSGSLSEEDRWDVVNYMHGMSRGYQGRLLNPKVMPEKPSLGPPIFPYFAHDGSSGVIKDFRQNNNVLLVLFSWPQSQERLLELTEIYDRLKKLDTIVLAVPMGNLSKQVLAEITENIPFPVVTEGAREITDSYVLYRRTLTHPDILGEGNIPDHLEFLIDRFGYLRARWIPSVDELKWSDISLLTQQLSQLNQEGEILPPPKDHVH
ncbi:MAG: CopD family protein [Nitrosomonas sp.]|nr:CopD family protein [Nitrosomonas sp.]MBK7365755.1 CopD family protein [Nitrosomonas sp.]